ncbi:MAG: hypothetical protein AAF620_16860 [Bacteroidota bacterium]
MVIFDRIIIGSSPIAVMLAVKFSRAGLSTVIIEAETEIGGAWKIKYIPEVGFTETACHLIEFYGNAYDVISDLIGIQFKEPEVQPIKILENGKQFPYTSRKSIVFEFIQLLLFYCTVFLIRAFNACVPSSLKFKKGERFSLFSLREKVWFSFRYRLLNLFNFNGIKEPVGGYVTFLQKLKDSIEENDIGLVSEKVISIRGNHLSGQKILLSSGRELLTKKTYITESVSILNENISRPKFATSKEYWHVLASMLKSQASVIRPYIHFPQNKYIHRITASSHKSLIKEDHLRIYFLIQLRKHPNDIPYLKLKIEEALKFCKAAHENPNVILHEVFIEEFIGDSKNSQYSYGEDIGGLHIIKTVGDLAKAVIVNSELRE